MCQFELKKLNLERESRRESNRQSVGEYNTEKQIDGYLDFGKKNFPELQAELEYYMEKAKSLETEVKTMDLELEFHRKEREDIEMLKDQIFQVEKQLQHVISDNG